MRLLPFLLCAVSTVHAQLPEEIKARIDSLERAQIRLAKERVTTRSRLDSLNTTISRAYQRQGLLDTIAARIAKACTIHEKPDILSPKLVSADTGDTVVVVDYATEWFKIMHQAGTGFVLEECLHHDERMRSYKQERLQRAGEVASEQPPSPDSTTADTLDRHP
jgi:hypothetical protein